MSDNETCVHVDAKIIGRHAEQGNKQTFVAYSIVGSDISNCEEITDPDAHQTDIAELYAIDLAIRDLQHSKQHFILLCDNESVVSELNRPDLKITPRTKKMKKTVREELAANPNFKIKLFPANLAHKKLDARWNELKKKESS